jgi:hexosaminidase
MEVRRQVWPMPTGLEQYTTVEQSILQVVARDSFVFLVDSGLSLDENNRRFLEKAEKRFFSSLDQQTPDSARRYPVNPKHKQVWEMSGVRIHVKTKRQLQHAVDESYELQVLPVIDNDSFVVLTATTVFGVVRGLQTFLQLLDFGWIDNLDQRQSAVFLLSSAPLHVIDRPVYPYRGLMIDTSRHYLPLSLILSNLDAMEMNKLNVLHWHMTDSQSWPYKSDVYPELATKGSYCNECVYDSRDVARVIREASDRGIRVVLEIDLPGHSQCTCAVAAAMPLVMDYVLSSPPTLSFFPQQPQRLVLLIQSF